MSITSSRSCGGRGARATSFRRALRQLGAILATAAVALPSRAEDRPSPPTSVEPARPAQSDAPEPATESAETELARLLTVHHIRAHAPTPWGCFSRASTASPRPIHASSRMLASTFVVA